MSLDLTVLRGFLDRSGVVTDGPLRADLIGGGRSNLTYDVTDGAHRWVVRRPPVSGLTPSAHDMAREWTVTAALQSTTVPVAPAVAADLTGDVLGAPFTVMGWVDGQVVRSRDDLEGLSDADIAGAIDSLVGTLADLHAVDPAAVGLADFGRPRGFLARQTALWARQWAHVKTRDLPDLDRLAELLAGSVPERDVAAVVHGDFRLDNAIVDRDDPGRVLAVVDWELSTLGDPLTDIALMCTYREPAFDTVLGHPAAWTSRRLPSPDDLAEAYSSHTGIALEHWGFFLGLAHLKLAVIAEGIAFRATQGAAADHTAAAAADAVPAFVAAGLAALRTPA